jgi:peptide/nickel transport system permease protein
MASYLLRRVLLCVPVLLGITIINFAFIRLAPGDPISMMTPPEVLETGSQQISDAVRHQMEVRLGLDQPLPIQYLDWLREIATGNLGRSLSTGRSILPELSERLWPTFELMGTALLISVVLGVTAGILSATRPYSWFDYLASIVAMVGISVPNFFQALVFIWIFAIFLQWLPTSGMATLGAPPSVWDSLSHLILPALVLGLAGAASLARYTRSSLLEVLRQDFVTTARSKGLAESVVLARHAVRNGILPVITIISLQVPHLVGGAVIVEQIFYWQGAGLLAMNAVLERDYPTIMAFNLMSAIVVLVANLLADITYAVVDPRIRYSAQTR